MGNASGNPKYHSKASALNIIGDDSWTNLKNKWSNLPDSSVSVHVFYQIIRLSYESAVSIMFFKGYYLCIKMKHLLLCYAVLAIYSLRTFVSAYSLALSMISPRQSMFLISYPLLRWCLGTTKGL